MYGPLGLTVGSPLIQINLPRTTIKFWLPYFLIQSEGALPNPFQHNPLLVIIPIVVTPEEAYKKIIICSSASL